VSHEGKRGERGEGGEGLEEFHGRRLRQSVRALSADFRGGSMALA
jgi:hypothetical protein